MRCDAFGAGLPSKHANALIELPTRLPPEGARAKLAIDEESETGYVNMSAAVRASADLAEAFEISNATRQTIMQGARQYNYHRSARKSVMLNLGLPPTQLARTESTHHAGDIVDVYKKETTDSCKKLYVSVLIGIGTFELSKAVARCGWLGGAMVLSFFGAVHHFQCMCLLEVPQLLQCSVDTYTGVAKQCFSRNGWLFFSGCSMATWWLISVLYLQAMVTFIVMVLNIDPEGHVAGIVKFACAVIVTSSAYSTSGAKDLKRPARYAFRAMLAVVVLEVFCAACHFLWNFRENSYSVWTLSLDRTESGIFDMVIAFGGAGILPYIVSEMVHPQEAQRMVSKAVKEIVIIYLVVGLVCYLGWGDDIRTKAPLQIMQKLGSGHAVAAALIVPLFLVKSVFTYPIFFWPLWREIDQCFGLDEAPCMQLQLPWALKLHSRKKTALRLGLVAGTVLPFFLGAKCLRILDEAAPVLSMITQFLGPSLMSLQAMRMNRRTWGPHGSQADELQFRKTFALVVVCFFLMCFIGAVIFAEALKIAWGQLSFNPTDYV